MLLLLACMDYNPVPHTDGTSPTDTDVLVDTGEVKVDTGDTEDTGETVETGIIETGDPLDTEDTGQDTGEPVEDTCKFVVTLDSAGHLQASPLTENGLEPPVSLGVASQHAVIADVDDDGELEVIAWENNALVQLDGDPCAGLAMASTPLNRAFIPRAVGDLDNDGVDDILGWTDQGQGVVGLGGSSGFTWIDVDVQAALSEYTSIAAYHLRDVTGDGNADLVVASYDGPAGEDTWLSLFLGNGDGTLGQRKALGGVDEPSNGADLGDVDGDGLVDLVFGLDDDGDAGQMYIALGTASGLGPIQELVDLQPNAESGTNAAGQGTLRLVDLDADADLDLLVLHRPNGGDFQTTVLSQLPYGVGFGNPVQEMDTSALGTKLTLAVP